MLTWMYKLLQRIPNVRGRAKLLSTIDTYFGPFAVQAEQGPRLSLFLASSQDASLASHCGANELLMRQLVALPKDGVFVDCGANCGFFSALAARSLGPDGVVFSIEPSFREFSRLAWANRNNQHQCKWQLFHCGVSERPTTAWLNTSSGHTGTNHIVTGPVRTGQPCVISTLDWVIDSFLDAEQSVDLIKIDIEGHELQALRGLERSLRAARVKNLVIEITPKFLERYGDSKEALYSYLREFGYRSVHNCESWQYDDLFVAPGTPV